MRQMPQKGVLMALVSEKENKLDFTILVHGAAAHGSTPHLGKDAIVAAAAIIQALQTLVSRVNNPLRPLVLALETSRRASNSISSVTRFSCRAPFWATTRNFWQRWQKN